MYTRRTMQSNGEPLRLPEHYSGVTFAKNAPKAYQEEEKQQKESVIFEEKDEEKQALPAECGEKSDPAPKKHAPLLGLAGREDVLLLILALLLLDDEGGDDMLAYILLGLLVLG